MFVFWLIIAFTAVLLYWYFEWRLLRAGINRVYSEEKFSFPGKRSHYVIAMFLITFFGVSASYFAITSFTRSGVVPGCWLIPAFIIGTLTAVSTLQRLRLLKSDDEIE
jgi:hypothetical protein